MEPRSCRYAAKYRIKRRRDFARVQTGGKKLYSKHFLIILKRAESDNSRLGITVTLKVDKRATARNRLKRRIREVFRKAIRTRLNENFDLVVIARRDACGCHVGEIEREILGTLQYHGFLNSLKR